MKSEAPATVTPAVPVAAVNQSQFEARKIPLAAKVAVTAFLAVLVPVYLHTYGPTNFLWFCDAALILTVAGMWLESSLLISMCAVGILLPQCLWLADFGSNLLGFHFLNLTGYMFDPHLPLFTRGLSLFHGWLPFLLVWLLFRLGYDKRALLAWTGLAAGLVLVCYFFTPPAGAIWPTPTSPSTSIIFTASTTSSRNTGSTKTCMSSCGWARCGSPPFFPRIWPCAKSSPRHRQRPDGKSQFDFKFLPAGQPDLDSLMFSRVIPDGATKVFGRIMWSEKREFSNSKNQRSQRNNNHETKGNKGS